MQVQVTIKCNGEITSDEVLEFISPWRALSDTIDGCGYIYHPMQVVKKGDVYKIELSDGTIVTAKQV